MQRIVALVGLLVLSACASSPGPASQPSSPAAVCPGYADLATARIPDGRLLLQAFDSAAPTSAQHPRQVGRTTGRGPSAEDTTTNRLLGVQVTSAPYMDVAARHSMARNLLEAYPAELRRARIGGDMVLVALVDTQGRVRETRIAKSSGHREMDNAAATVVRRARFEPAMAGECRVPYVLRLPVGFTS
jgi:TonB family protein